MSDPLHHETMVPLTAAAEFFPPGTSTRAMVRWIKQGCRGIHLEATKVGHRWHTSRAAVEQFLADCTSRSAPPSPAPRQHARGHASAMRLLKERFAINV